MLARRPSILWRFVLAGWAGAQHQHDCAEYLHHTVSRLCPQALAGDWSARRLEEDDQPAQTESGTCDQAVTLPLTAGDQLHAISFTAGIHNRRHMR